jgi:hypothetical protein
MTSYLLHVLCLRAVHIFQMQIACTLPYCSTCIPAAAHFLYFALLQYAYSSCTRLLVPCLTAVHVFQLQEFSCIFSYCITPIPATARCLYISLMQYTYSSCSTLLVPCLTEVHEFQLQKLYVLWPHYKSTSLQLFQIPKILENVLLL